MPASATDRRGAAGRDRVEILLQQIINGLTLGSVYALVALGYTMVYGIIGLINFAHGEVVMIGAMVSLSVVTALLGAQLPLPTAVIILVGLFVAILVCITIAYSMEKIAYRPLRKAPRLAPLITAIGMSIILQNAALVVWGRNDPSFIAPGAEAFRRDLPDAEIHLLDAGHFALDEKNDEVAALVLAFLAKHSV